MRFHDNDSDHFEQGHRGRYSASSSATAAGYSAGPAAIEKLWLLGAVAIIGAWAGISYLLFTSLGWFGRGIAVTSIVMAAGAVMLVIRGGGRFDTAAPVEVVEMDEARRAA